MNLFGGWVGWLLAAAVVLIPTCAVGRSAREVPPALTGERYASGFGGALWLFLAGQIAWLLTLVWQTAYMTSELWFMLERNPDTMKAAFVAVVPGAVSVLIGIWVIWQTAFRRTPAAAAYAVVGIWLMGPGASLLQSWYFGIELTPTSLAKLLGWSILWSLYFAVSPRAAMTYGTPRGKRLAAE